MEDKLMVEFKKNPAGEGFLNELISVIKEIREMQEKFEKILEKQIGSIEKNSMSLAKAINEPVKEEIKSAPKPKLSAREFFMQDYVKNTEIWREKFPDMTGETPELLWKYLFAKHRTELGSFIQIRVKALC